MSWPAVEAALDGILARRWYTNHGPLARRLEDVVATSMDVRHAVAVTNRTIGLLMLCEALELRGDVLVPATAPVRCVQALGWAGLSPGFCDVDRMLWLATVPTVLAAAGPATAAVLLTPGCTTDLADFARGRGLAVFSDGPGPATVPAVLRLPGIGDAAGAACVVTDDDALAARLRNIRSSYGAGPAVPVRRTANGRLSEAQAAMSLLAWPGDLLPDAALLRREFPERPVLPLGDRLALVLGDPSSRDGVLAAVPGTELVRLCSPPGVCPAADELAGLAVLLPRTVDLPALRAAL